MACSYCGSPRSLVPSEGRRVKCPECGHEHETLEPGILISAIGPVTVPEDLPLSVGVQAREARRTTAPVAGAERPGWVKWFGKSWGAPCCEPQDHAATPVGMLCLKCSEPIAKDDQGITMPFMSETGVSTIAYHLDCYLKKILPHTFDCRQCRGREREQHAASCAHRTSGDECDCFATWGPPL